MSVHSNRLSRPLQDRVDKSRAQQEEIPQEDLQEQLTRYLGGRRQALYLQLLQDDPQTMASPASPDNLLEVLGKLKEVEALRQEIQTITEGIRNARHTRKPYA